MKTSFTRRQFLVGAGGATLALPLLPSLLPRALAASVAPKKRFIGAFQPNCPVWSEWFKVPAATDLVGPNIRQRWLSTIDGSLSPILGAEFNSLKSKSLFLRGFDHIYWETHSTIKFLTCGESAVDRSAHISIDQVLREKLYSSEPRVRSLHLSVSPDSKYSTSWTRQGTQLVAVPQVTNPLVAFEQLFGTLDPNLTEEQLKRHYKHRLGAVDAVLDDYRRLFSSRKISSEDRGRLDSHVSFIRDLERRLQAEAAAGKLSCDPGSKPSGLDYAQVGNSPELENVITNFIDVLVAAIRCGMTQVGTLFLMDRGGTYSSFLPSQVGHQHDMTHQNNPEALAGLIAISKFHARKVAELANKLDVVEDPLTGTTYLDNTLIFWGHEFSGCEAEMPFIQPGLRDSLNHCGTDSPVMMIGGSSFLNTGRYVDFRRPETSVESLPFLKRGRPYNELLVTILQAMGLAPAEYEQGQAGWGVYRYKTRPEPVDMYDLTDTAKRTALPTLLKRG